MTIKSDDIASEIASNHPGLNLEAGRRAFMKSLAASAAVIGLAGAAATPASAAASLDIQILTFALNLEYLEAEFYLRAATGAGLPVSDIGGNAGQVLGGRMVNFQSSAIGAYATEIAADEKNHVEFLRAAIIGAGLVPASRPTIDLQNSFTTAAMAAGLIGSGQTFDAFANDANFLLASYIFEDVGVTAYHGAATSITNKTYLDKAAGILAVEAYHAGLIRGILFSLGYSNQTQAISYLRATLDGTAGTPAQNNDHGVGTVSAASVTNADGNSIAADRNTQQVLNIVYGKQNASSGLFFPNGINMPT
jgi:hypothetical protein